MDNRPKLATGAETARSAADRSSSNNRKCSTRSRIAAKPRRRASVNVRTQDKRIRKKADDDLAIVGAPHLRTIPVPQEGLRKLRSREIEVVEICTATSSAEPTTTTHLIVHPKPVQTVSTRNRRVKSKKSRLHKKPRKRTTVSQKSAMRFPVDEQSAQTKSTDELHSNAHQIICQALVAHSSNPILSAVRTKSHNIHQVILPLLRPPRFPHFSHSAPLVFDNLGLVRCWAAQLRGLTVQPGVASESLTLLYYLQWSSDLDLPKPSNIDQLQTVVNVRKMIIDQPYDSTTDPEDSESTLSAVEETDTAAHAISQSQQSFFESLVPPGITIVSIKNKKPTKLLAPQQLHKQEILISTIPSKKKQTQLTTTKKVVLTRNLPVPRNHISATSSTTTSSTKPPQYTPCLVVQCLPNTSNPTMASHPPKTILLKSAPTAALSTSRDLSGVTPKQFFGNPMNYLQHNPQVLGISSKSSTTYAPKTVPNHQYPTGSTYFQVTKAKRVEPNMNYKAKIPADQLKKEPIRKVLIKRKTKMSPKRKTPQMPFISDQLSCIPVTTPAPSSMTTRNRTCADCQTDVRDVSKCPKLLLDTDICGECCEKNLATSQFFDHDTVSLIPLDANMKPIQSTSDEFSDDSRLNEITSPPPAVGRRYANTSKHTEMFSLFPSNAVNASTVNLIDKAARRTIGNNPHLELQSIKIQLSPAASSSSSSGIGGTPSSLNRSPERAIAFEHLQHVLRQQLPFTSPIVTNHQNRQQVQFDCITLPNINNQPMRRENRFQFPTVFTANNAAPPRSQHITTSQLNQHTIYITSAQQFIPKSSATSVRPTFTNAPRPTITNPARPNSSRTFQPTNTRNSLPYATRCPAPHYFPSPRPTSSAYVVSPSHPNGSHSSTTLSTNTKIRALQTLPHRTPTPPPTPPPKIIVCRAPHLQYKALPLVVQSSNRTHPQDALRNANTSAGPPFEETFEDIMEYLNNDTRCWSDDAHLMAMATANAIRTPPPRRIAAAASGLIHGNAHQVLSADFGSPIDLTVRRPSPIVHRGKTPSDVDVFIDVESVDNGSGANLRNHLCLRHSDQPILRRTSPIVGGAKPLVAPVRRQPKLKCTPKPRPLPLSTHYTTIPTPCITTPSPVQAPPNAFHHFFQNNPNPKTIAGEPKTTTAPVSGYAMQMYKKISESAVISPSSVGRKKKSRKTPLHPVTGDSSNGPTVPKRKLTTMCRSPLVQAAVAQQQHKHNDIDIVMRVEASEYSLEALDDIPVDQLFVAEQELNLNDYLI